MNHRWFGQFSTLYARNLFCWATVILLGYAAAIVHPASAQTEYNSDMTQIGVTPELHDDIQTNFIDQDTSIMRWQREGMHASAKGAQTFSSYQESRIRRIHETLMKSTRP